MISQPGSWEWGLFFFFGIGCFFAGMVTGLLGIPGLIAVLFGALLGLWAARRAWFERG
jgi:hypothetical protein